MGVYDINKNILSTVYDVNGNSLDFAYDKDGNKIFSVNKEPIIRGTVYNFSDMSMTDESGITTTSEEHLENASSGIKLTTPEALTEYTVTFDGLNIETNGEAFNLWFYISRADKGVTGGWGEYSTFTTVYVSLNGGRKKSLSISSSAYSTMLIAGKTCYHWLKSETPATITSISIGIKSDKAGGSIILDSVEIGRKFAIPHFLFNFDSSGKNFYNVGYPLFKLYGMPATFDYWGCSTDGGNSGTWDDETDAQKHFEMIADGFDYGIYSKYVASNNSSGTSPAYDDISEESMSLWREQATLMFDSNNSLGIYYPSTVHSTGHKSGEAYAKAMAEKDFMIVRADSAYSTGNIARQFITNIDHDSYKEVVPYYVVNTWEADDSGVTATKKIIDLAISENMAVMWMSHTILAADADHTDNTIDIGYNAMIEILEYLKEKRDAGLIQVDSTATFMQEVYPDIYNDWISKRTALEDAFNLSR